MRHFNYVQQPVREKGHTPLQPLLLPTQFPNTKSSFGNADIAGEGEFKPNGSGMPVSSQFLLWLNLGELRSPISRTPIRRNSDEWTTRSAERVGPAEVQEPEVSLRGSL